MKQMRSEIRSPYMEFAKLRSHARFNLATSGLAGLPLSDLPVRLEDLQLSSPGGYGYPPLMERLAKKAGVPVNCVVAATGTSMANHLAMAGILEPGDEVLIEHPTYELLVTVAEYLGARVRRFPRRFEDGFRVDPGEVAKAMTPRTQLIVLTNFHNPSGVRIDDAALREVGELARNAGARVLVDEVYLDMLFDPSVRPAFHLGEHFVVTSSLTKAYGLSGLRCGWILAAPELAERIWRLNDLYGVIPPPVAEQLSVIALDHLDEISGRARALLGKNRLALDQFLDSRQDLAAVRAPAGTIVFPRLLTGTVDRLCALLREKYDTTVVPGKFFEMPEHFRLGIGGDSEMTCEGLNRLAAALDELSG
ncbi:MAG: pyridoxal phosphate-dependent aminotransferase [Candidatus Acidiferrales bacterium]